MSKQPLSKDQQEIKDLKMKARIETAKTILITILVTSIIAFVAGYHYNQTKNDQMNRTVNEQIKLLK